MQVKVTGIVSEAAVRKLRGIFLRKLSNEQASTLRTSDVGVNAWWEALRVFDEHFGIEEDEGDVTPEVKPWTAKLRLDCYSVHGPNGEFFVVSDTAKNAGLAERLTSLLTADDQAKK